jgi:putative heme-binding domain-containing protein
MLAILPLAGYHRTSPPPSNSSPTEIPAPNQMLCMVFNLRSPRTFSVLASIVLSLTLGSRADAAGLGVTPAERISVPEGFKVELLHEVSSESEGSWVSLTTDEKGRLIACDQYGGLFRIDVSGDSAKVEKLKVDFKGAQGLLCAFGALYANVNSQEQASGLYRLTDTDGDDQYDKVDHLIPMNGGSEHGPHGLILTPDKKRIVLVAGNNTDLPKGITTSRVPQVYQEDHLLGRMPDARGHNAHRMAPGGFILSLDPDGSNIELICTGFRNPYDIALNLDGELFTYDADMEWDVGTPWYRPTRINHVISGAEFGWRNGTGKWPAYYPDSFGSVVDIGPGSPTGICFGYGAKFPAKYQNALFIFDWSYGNIHAVHMESEGSSFKGTFETFATASPLPVTDLVVHPDGAMYFTIGGRKTQSGLYRIRYVGTESTEPVQASGVNEQVALRRSLEAMHVGKSSESDIQKAIEHLGSGDRAIRFAARVAIEHLGADVVRQAMTKASSDLAKIHATVALARTGQASDRELALKTLGQLEWDSLTPDAQIDALRALGLVALRLGGVEGDLAKPFIERWSGKFPTGENRVDRELAQVLIYLRDESATSRIVQEMRSSPSQENQIHYAMALRNAKHGWTESNQKDYFQWFNDMATARGGMSFGGFLTNIKAVAVENLTPADKERLASVLNPPKSTQDEKAMAPRPLVKQWTVEELEKSLSESQAEPNFQRGKDLFAAAQCYKCHRMGLQGGILGPDLTSAGGKYGVRDMLISIVQPDKEISDQYGATQFVLDDGRVVVGRVINMHEKKLSVLTNMLDPSSLTEVNRDSVEESLESKTSMMPSGLLDTFTAEEIADLVAYLRSGGEAKHAIYTKPVAVK